MAFLPAELLHVSGVLAVVTCGLVTMRRGPRVISPQARVQAVAFWQVTSHLLNSALFFLVGTQLPAAFRALDSVSLLQAATAAALISVVVFGTRVLWFYTVPYLIRLLDRRPGQRARRITAAQRLPLAWAGMRGAISLAAALTIPAVTTEGRAMQQRDAVIFITAVVIVASLTVMGPTLPSIVRRARYPESDEEASSELALAHRHLGAKALAALPDLLVRHRIGEDAAERIAQHISEQAGPSFTSEAVDKRRALERDLLSVKREALTELRDLGRIDDIVLRRVQEYLDVEDLRLSRTARSDEHAAEL
jgi:CPA1 family monovalent cation:H+ antiporter